MNQVNIINKTQSQATDNNVARNAFMVGQVNGTAIMLQLAGDNVPSDLIKRFFPQPVTLI